MTRFSAALVTAGVVMAAAAPVASAGPAVPPRAVGAPQPHGDLREYVSITHRAPAPPLGACTAPDYADSASAFALAPWRISSTLDVTLSTRSVPSSVGVGGFEAALDGAIGTWEATDLPGSAFTRLSSASIKPPLQKLDGTNVVGFGRIGNAVGLTRFWVDRSTGDVVEFDTVLNVGYPWSTASTGNLENCSGTPGAFDVQAVLTHELGHPVGLEHVDNDVQTMYAYVGTGETRKRTLAAGDVAGANAKY